MRGLIGLIGLFIALISGCRLEQSDSAIQTLKNLQAANPVVDAQQSISANDFRFLAVHNHDLKMPVNIKACLVDQYNYRLLDNRSFDYGSYEFQKYAAIATIYANWYNFTVLSHLEKQGLDKCETQQ